MDEYEIISLLTQAAGSLPPDYSAIGDDVAWMKTVPGRLILKADMLVGRTDIPPGMTWRQAGRKALAMCVSDFASKGVAPRAFMLSLGIPGKTRPTEVRSMVRGFQDGMEEWGVRLIGGDTNESDDLIIDCIMTGFAKHIVERGGARPGDYVVVTGDFGTVSAGLKILLENAKAGAAFRRLSLRSVYLPEPRLKLGVALRSLFSSAMDSSDGLAICLHALASASGVGISVDVLPHAAGLEEFAAANGYKSEELILYGGEEYEIVGTIPARRLERAERVASSMGAELKAIGKVTESGSVEMRNGTPVDRKGWIHLS